MQVGIVELLDPALERTNRRPILRWFCGRRQLPAWRPIALRDGRPGSRTLALPAFVQVFGDAAARREWFAQMIQSALVATVTGAYAPFGQIGDAALTMVAARRGVTLAEDARRQLLGGRLRMPPHPEVRLALERLRAAGLRLAALTNSTADVAEAQLTHAGLAELFELRLSVDAVRRLKPASEAYQLAAERLGVPLGEIRLVAAHAWDIAGALRAGCAGAFVARPGMVLDPLVPAPDVVGADMTAVAEQILVAEGVRA